MLENKLNLYVVLSIGMACLQFVLILCIPFLNIEGETKQQIISYIVAMLFWMSIFAEVLLARLSDRVRRKLERKLYRDKEIKNSMAGIFSFFKNTEAMIADIVLFVIVLLLGIIIWLHIKAIWVIIGTVSVLILSFSLHCIFNGRNYRYLKKLKNNTKEQKKDV